MKGIEWIRPSKRQMIARCIEGLVGAHKIKTARTDDGLLWCTVDMTEPSDTVLATLGMIIMSWGPPVLMDKGDREVRYLFDPLHARVTARTDITLAESLDILPSSWFTPWIRPGD